MKLTCEVCGNEITEYQQEQGYCPAGKAWTAGVGEYQTGPQHLSCSGAAAVAKHVQASSKVKP